MKVIPEVRREHKMLYLRFYCEHWADISVGELFSSRGTNMALTWLIRYMYYRNLQFLNKVIKNKANVLLRRHMSPLPILVILFRPFVCIASKVFYCSALQSFGFKRT